MRLKPCSQNEEIKLSKVQTHNSDASFLKNEQNWRWNKVVLRRHLGKDMLSFGEIDSDKFLGKTYFFWRDRFSWTLDKDMPSFREIDSLGLLVKTCHHLER